MLAAGNRAALAKTSKPWSLAAFQGVFDERVACALAALGIPRREAFLDLSRKVAELERAVAQLAGGDRKKPGRRGGPNR